MRTIKFRIWEKEQNKCWCPIVVIDKNGEIYFKVSSQGDGHTALRGPLKKEAFDIMQFTGLLDKNGKEIYEGDVVKDSTCGDDYEVIFKQGCFFLKANFTRFVYEKEVKIIGNIYENKELIKKK